MLFFINFSSFKPDTDNNANFDAVSSKRGNFDAVQKMRQILIKNLYECKRYNAWQFIKSLWTRVERRTASAGCWWSSEQSTGVWAAADAVRILMETSTQMSRCCWVRKTNHRATEQLEKFHVRRGIHRSSVSQIIHKVQVLQEKALLTADWSAQNARVIFGMQFERDNAIISKPTWKSIHANSILEPSEYFYQISSKSIHTISSYTVAKFGRFFETHCMW